MTLDMRQSYKHHCTNTNKILQGLNNAQHHISGARVSFIREDRTNRRELLSSSSIRTQEVNLLNIL